MEKFVCVRVVLIEDIDVSPFQFDYDQSFAVFFMNGDGAVYGRYGTRSTWEARDNTLEGLKEAMRGALEVHAGYPGNRESLKGKAGTAPGLGITRKIPQLKAYTHCIQCHNIHEAEVRQLRVAKEPVPDRLLWSYSMPDRLGLTLDPDRRAQVSSVAAGSPAAKAGLKPGDGILTLEGQPMLSVADVQWVLQWAKEGGALKAEVKRGGEMVKATLETPAGWRRSGGFAWRKTFVEYLQATLLGIRGLEELAAGDRKTLGLSNADMALRITKPAREQMPYRNLEGLQKLQPGDVIVDVGGLKSLKTESDFLAYLTQKKKSGDTVALGVVRGGKRLKLELTLP